MTCCAAGAVARELVTFYCEGDTVAMSGVYEPRPSTASSKTPWAGRFRVHALVVEASIEFGEWQWNPLSGDHRQSSSMSRSSDRREEGMCSVLLPGYHQSPTLKLSTAVPCFMRPELRRGVPDRRERALKLRCSGLVMGAVPIRAGLSRRRSTGSGKGDRNYPVDKPAAIGRMAYQKADGDP